MVWFSGLGKSEGWCETLWPPPWASEPLEVGTRLSQQPAATAAPSEPLKKEKQKEEIEASTYFKLRIKICSKSIPKFIQFHT